MFFIEKYLWFIPEELNLKIGKSLSRVAHFILPGDAKYLLGLCDLAFLSNPGVPPSDYVILAHGWLYWLHLILGISFQHCNQFSKKLGNTIKTVILPSFSSLLPLHSATSITLRVKHVYIYASRNVWLNMSMVQCCIMQGKISMFLVQLATYWTNLAFNRVLVNNNGTSWYISHESNFLMKISRQWWDVWFGCDASMQYSENHRQIVFIMACGWS